MVVMPAALLGVAAPASAAEQVDRFVLDRPPALDMSDIPVGGPAFGPTGLSWAEAARSRPWTVRTLGAGGLVTRRLTPGTDEVVLEGGAEVLAVRERALVIDPYESEINQDRLLAFGPDALDLTPCQDPACAPPVFPTGLEFAAADRRVARLGRAGDDEVIVIRDVVSQAEQRVLVEQPADAALPSEPIVGGIRLAGPFLAWEQISGTRRIVIRDLRDAAVSTITRSSKAESGSWDLQADGKVVTSDDTGVAWFAPGDPRHNLVGGAARGRPRIAGDRILYVRRADGSLVLAELDARRTVVARHARRRALVGDAAFDGRRAAWIERSCRVVRVLLATDVAAERPRPLPPPTDCGEPHVRALRLTDGGRTLVAEIVCTAGCRGTASFGLAGRRDFTYRAARGARRLRLALTPRAARLVEARRGRNLAVTLTLRSGGRVEVRAPLRLPLR